MAILENARHEIFAQALAAGKTPTEACVAAGFTPTAAKITKLMANVNIQRRVAELQVPVPVPDPGGGFNGGRSQLNFNFLQIGGAYPFINALKGAQAWKCSLDNMAAPPSTLNVNGYPTSMVQSGVYTVFSIPSAANRPGNWKIRWTGTGRITATGGFDQTATDGNFSYVPGNTRIDLRIRSGTNLTKIEFFHEDDEADLNAGKIFSAPFLALLREANWGVLRFLDWQRNNKTNVRYWADRRPVGYAFYSGPEMRASIYGGVTTNSGDNFSVAAPPGWGGLVDKAIVTVKFNASAVSQTLTLNVGGTGAKAMRGPFGDLVSASSGKPVINKFGTMVFDADLDCWLKDGGDGTGDQFLENGVPIEVMLTLCKEVGAHPWWCPPMFACDPVTDWTTNLATYCRDNAPAWMISRYEAAPNESWNGAAGFYPTRYGWLKAKDHWSSTGTTDIHNWVGKVASLQGQAVSAVYANNRVRYWMVLGVQAHGGTGSSVSNRLSSALYVSQNAGKPAHDWVTHVACANYYRDTYTAAQRTAAGDAYAAADTAEKLAIATAFVNSASVDLPDKQYQFGVPRLIALFAAFKAWAAGYGVMGFTCYEGGWSPDYVLGETNLNALKNGSRMVAALAGHTTDVYEGLISKGGEFPSHYYLGGTGVWALYDPDIYVTPSPQWNAIVAFNA